MQDANINFGIDIDGTLTKDKIGKELLRLSSRDIEKRLMDCAPNDGIDVLLENHYNYYLITGRQERYREITKEWLKTYGIPYKDLSMFPDDFYVIYGYDIPKYVGLKLGMHIKKNIHVALDDNEYTVKVFNQFGIPTCRVDSNFREAFDKALKLRDTNRDSCR